MKLSLYIIPVFIIIVAIVAYLAGAWMFFSYLIAAFGILVLATIEMPFIGLAHEDKIIEIYQTRGPDELKKIVRTKLIFITVYNVLCLILSFYPFAFMSSSFSWFFHLWEPYEGGLLVTVIFIFNLVVTGLLIWNSIHNLITIDRTINTINNNLSKQQYRLKKEEESKLKQKKLIESIAPIDNVTTVGETLFAVSSANNKVIIGKRIYDLSDIISFSISDNSTQIFTPATSITKTNTGSMVGRAVVGRVLMGETGAIIGGATANKETFTEGGSYKISHDYTLHITMDNLTEPLLSIHIGNSTSKMEKAKALLNVIVKRNASI